MNDKALQICSYEQSQRLKAAGFDWPVYDFYNGTILDCDGKDNYNNLNDYISVPSVSLGLKWLRGVKGFYGYVYRKSNGYFHAEWNVFLKNGHFQSFGIEQSDLKTYEEAESYLLDDMIAFLEKSKLL